MYARVKTLPRLSEEDEEKILSMFGADRQTREDAVQILKEWLHSQPHLPKNVEEAMLAQTFFKCKNSIQKAKDAIDMYYTLRTALPEFFSNRDPKSDWFERYSSIGAVIPMPRLTENNDRVIIFRGMVPDVSGIDIVNAFKALFMIFDIRIRCDIYARDVWVFDFMYSTPEVLLKYTPTLMKKVSIMCSKGYKGKLKEVHLINASPYVCSFVSLLKRVINKEKNINKIHIHPKGHDNLHQFVDRKCLPEEYGGDAGPLQQHWDAWKETLVECREWFLEQENVKVDESKRPQKSVTYNDLFGFEGSFRQLSLD